MNAREANYFAGTRTRGRTSRSTESIYSNTPIIPTDDLCQAERSGAGASVLDEFDPGGPFIGTSRHDFRLKKLK